MAGLFRPELTVGWGATCGIFFLSGLTLPTSELAAAAFRVREHTAIQGVNLVVLPSIMWLVTTLLGARISATLRAGLLAMSALPTTVNMCVALTRSAGGNEALAIFNAVIGNVLGVVVTPPLLLLLLGASVDISIVDAMTKLTKKVIVPLVVGQLVRPALADALKVRTLTLGPNPSPNPSPSPSPHALQGRKKLLSRSSETLLLAIVYTTFCDTFLRGFGMPASTVALLGAPIDAHCMRTAYALHAHCMCATYTGALLAAGHVACLGLTWQLAKLLGLQARRAALIMSSTLYMHMLHTRCMHTACTLHARCMCMCMCTTRIHCTCCAACALQARDRIAFIMCSTHKTLALGLPLFKVIFAGRSDLAVLCTPLLLQHPLQLIIGSILAPRLKKIAEAEDASAP